jgi:predicted enzyme related to lactoylglutathione lyase
MFTPRIDHVEWRTRDVKGLQVFLTGLFGWAFEAFGENYFFYAAGPGATTVGLEYDPNARAGGTPYVSVEVTSIDEVLQQAVALGGGVTLAKKEIAPGLGYQAVVTAPDGNVIGLFERERLP